METTSQPKIVKRFGFGDPDFVCEVIEDGLAARRWIRLWMHRDRRWSAYNLTKDRAKTLWSLLDSSRSVLR